MSVWSRLANVFRSGALERELNDELQFHLEERARELMAAGMTREEATEAARRRFGSPLRVREQSRDVKLLPWLESIVRDVRLGGRMLRKNAGVTATAVMSLALALGACIAAFSLLDALILRPLPVRNPEQLVYLAFPTYNSERPESDTFDDPVFLRLREAGRGQVDLFAMSTQVIRRAAFADAGGDKESLRTQYVSGDAFATLGVAPRLGDVAHSRGRWAAGNQPGRGREPRVLDATVRRRSRRRRTMADARRSSTADRRRGRASLHGRRTGASDGPVSSPTPCIAGGRSAMPTSTGFVFSAV